MDDDLISEFFIDTQAHLEAVEADLLKLEQAPSDMELIDDVFRRVHSVKGNAGMLGLMSIHSVGQDFETFLGGVRERGAATAGEIDMMFQALDTLKAAVTDVKGEKEPGGETGEDEPPTPETASAAAPAPGTPDEPEPQAASPAALKPAAPQAQKAMEKEAPEKPGQKRNGKPATFLLFDLSGERYGLEITKVREIITMDHITPVPNTKSFVSGVMNLRDQVIPVFDLKTRLDMPVAEKDEEKNIIVMDIDRETTGLKVDEVTGIATLKEEDITPPGEFHGAIPSSYLYGTGKTGGRTIILLDAEQVCGPDELLYEAGGG